MSKALGVRFKKVGKINYFEQSEDECKIGDMVVANTLKGLECGEVVTINDIIEDELPYSKMKLKPIIRKADQKDLTQLKMNQEKAKRAFAICNKKIQVHDLKKMKLVDVEYTLDAKKILFYFSADGKIDFRDLVKDLAAIFRTRIELRQIGVRDQSKILGGLGICGRPFCCNTFLDDFRPVSIKMAKEQGLSLNPLKISGTCGRLMCCLQHEQEAYEDLIKNTPKVGAYVSTPEGNGTVIEVNMITGGLRVLLDDKREILPHNYNKKDVVVIKDGHRED